MRYWLSELGIQSPSLAVLNQLMPEVLNAADDAMPILQWNGWQFRRFNQQLFVIRASLEKVLIHKIWQGEESIQLPENMGRLTFTQINDVSTNDVSTNGVSTNNMQTNNKRIDDTSQLIVNPNLGAILIRSGGYSARFRPAGSNHSKPVKQWFKQWKVAPWFRDSVLLIIQNEQVLGLFIAGCWKIADKGDIKSVNDPQWLITLAH